jgi:hypothetical protein
MRSEQSPLLSLILSLYYLCCTGEACSGSETAFLLSFRDLLSLTSWFKGFAFNSDRRQTVCSSHRVINITEMFAGRENHICGPQNKNLMTTYLLRVAFLDLGVKFCGMIFSRYRTNTDISIRNRYWHIDTIPILIHRYDTHTDIDMTQIMIHRYDTDTDIDMTSILTYRHNTDTDIDSTPILIYRYDADTDISIRHRYWYIYVSSWVMGSFLEGIKF